MRLFRLLPLLSLGGCALSEPVPDALPGVAPPPMSLTVASPWALRGTSLQLEVRGGPPQRNVAFLGTLAASGPAACPAVLAPACLAIPSPFRVLATPRASTVGTAHLSPTLPPTITGGTLRLQAVAPDAAGAWLSNVVTVRVLDPAGDEDLDAVTNVDEAGLGLDPLAADTDGDGTDDGAELAAGTDPLVPDARCADIPERLPLRRLTRTQLGNTLHAVAAILPNDAPEWVASVIDAVVAEIPPDVRRGAPSERRGGFARVDQDVLQEHADAWTAAAARTAELMGRSWHITPYMADQCNLGAAPVPCAEQFIRRFGPLVHRRPLAEDDVAFYQQVFEDAMATATGASWERLDRACQDLVAVMLAGPHVAWHVEATLAAQPGDSTPGAALDGWSLANRLSYQLWDAPPDEALRAAAADGSLLVDAVYEAHARRLQADPRAAEPLSTFFREWLRADDVPDPGSRVGTPRFDALRGALEFDRETTDAVRDELADLGVWHAHTAPTSLDDLIRTDVLLTQDPVLATLYGAAPWDGQGTPPSLAEPERTGLLTRVAMLTSGIADTRPIHKGLVVREALLCDDMPPPPDNVAAQPPAPDPTRSTREVVETLTEQPGSVCIACHGTLLNPLGFATEGFDALGRVRSEQPLFDDAGRRVGTAAVRTDGTTWIDGDLVGITGPADLTEALLASGDLHACFARGAARWTLQRADDGEPGLGCATERLAQRLRAGDPLDEAFLSLVLDPTFRRSTTPDVGGAP